MSDRKSTHRDGFNPLNVSVEKLKNMILEKNQSLLKTKSEMERLEDLMIRRHDEKLNMVKWHNDWSNLFLKYDQGIAFVKSLEETIINISENEN